MFLLDIGLATISKDLQCNSIDPEVEGMVHSHFKFKRRVINADVVGYHINKIKKPCSWCILFIKEVI